MRVLSPAPLQTIPAQTGVAFELKRGQLLRVVDPQGAQVSDLFCFSAADPAEHFSASRSIDYADTLFLTTGHVLYSNRSQAMLRIVEDSCGRHDLLMPPCSLRMFQIVAGNEDYHPSCHENLARSLGRFGFGPDAIGTTFNIFMNVSVDPRGAIQIAPPLSRAGASVLLRAEMDLLVGLTACSHEGTNAGVCKPIQYQVLDEPRA
ncbi:DUF1989 domain-containing protein [Hyalangium gracile]|uniref:DUF1989 domain-containing protein n=1 Tax=Hyalangium gracile TaxID=394092 RepID=UPI001CCB1980|nr:urea carboxylase-associated family protein [Hyalangium gracile]